MEGSQQRPGLIKTRTHMQANIVSRALRTEARCGKYFKNDTKLLRTSGSLLAVSTKLPWKFISSLDEVC